MGFCYFADFSADVADKSSTIRAFLPDRPRKKNNFARRTLPIRIFSIFSIAGLYNGNLRSTPTPYDSRRTVKDALLPYRHHVR